MKLTQKDITELRRNGATVSSASDSKDRSMESLLAKLSALIERPAPSIVVNPPQVTITPPQVTVKTPEVTIQSPNQSKRWKFVITKDQYGQTKEIVATAME